MTRYLLSNNLSAEDRLVFDNLYKAHNRVCWLAGGAGLVIAVEMTLRLQRLKAMAPGWRFLSCVGLAFAAQSAILLYSSRQLTPLLGAYLRKYKQCVVEDPFEIRDRTREYYEIDDSQYMAYTLDDLKHEHSHANHGPQPDGEVMDCSYLEEVDKFLAGKENHLTDHKMFLKYPFDYVDKSFPSQDAAKELMSGKL